MHTAHLMIVDKEKCIMKKGVKKIRPCFFFPSSYSICPSMHIRREVGQDELLLIMKIISSFTLKKL